MVMKKIQVLSVLLAVCSFELQGQTILSYVPDSVSPSDSYLFYLHGGVVQDQGIPAVSEHFGAYEYLAILDSLSDYQVNIISEVRSKDTEIEEYGRKVFLQVDSLLKMGVLPQNITVIGASLGAYMAMEAAIRLNNSSINYVLIGLCSDYAVGYFEKYTGQLKGNYLSIFENSDAKGSCSGLFINTTSETAFTEIRLNMGINHSFLFKPYDEWVKPMMKWIKTSQIE